MRVLLVSFDCLPRRWLGCYGGHDLPTPGFDALSAYGTTYDLAFATKVPCSDEPLSASPSPDVAVRKLGGQSSKGRKRRTDGDASQLVKSLDEGIAFLEEASSKPALAVLRHSGFHVQARPRMSAAEVESVAEQLVELDCSIGVFFERWRETAEDDWRLIVMGAEGLLQPDESDASELQPRLCDDWVHVPMWIVVGAGELFGRRDSRLVTTDALGPTLQNWFRAADAEPDERLIVDPGGADEILIRGVGQRAIRTRDWFFRLSEGGDERELFRKPEDVWDVHDLADRRPELCEDLAARLAAGA